MVTFNLLVVILSICGVNFVAVKGNYVLQVRLYSYSNPSERCAICIGTGGLMDNGPRCCDSEALSSCIGLETGCDTFYRYCLRPLGTSGSSVGCSGGMLKSDVNENDGVLDFSSQVVLGLNNPLSLPGLTDAWNGVQLFIEVADRDPINGFDDIIDRFYIDIFQANVPVGIESARTTYRGVHRLAQMDLSFRVVCAENFAGADCSECTPGYTGPFCRTDIDNCEGVDCSGRGQCIDGVNSFSCVCNSGYNGRLCERNINECIGVECSGNGQCVDEINSFTCVCNPAYTGRLCERNIDDCVGVDCSGNGRCIDGVNSFSCHCNGGYSGQFCEKNSDDCIGVDCGTHGQCVDGLNTFTCNCDPGYSGERCEVNKNDCEGIWCNGNGECIDGEGSFVCKCYPGFTGTKCKVNINDCEGITCSGHGLCIDGVNNYTCSCSAGFSGELCEHNIDDCIGIGCCGKGQCVDGIDSYTCVCISGFEGENCEINIDECAGVKCNGNSTCVDGINSFTCVCDPGLTGELCDQPLTESSSEGDILNYMIYFGAGFGAILLIVIILLCVLIVTFALRRNNKKGRQDPCTSKQPHVHVDPSDNMELQRNATYNLRSNFGRDNNHSGSSFGHDTAYQAYNSSNTPIHVYDYITIR